jgi:hypothetical protein
LLAGRFSLTLGNPDGTMMRAGGLPMKTRVAVILIVVALAVAVFAIIRYPRASRPTPPAPAPPPPVAEPKVVAASPTEAVVGYVEALYRKDYEEAWEHLSKPSQLAHPFEKFLQRAETGEATNLDLAAAEAGKEEQGRVLVTVPLVEDPASAGLTTEREGKGWKVVYIGGEPWFPYPEDEPGAATE